MTDDDDSPMTVFDLDAVIQCAFAEYKVEAGFKGPDIDYHLVYQNDESEVVIYADRHGRIISPHVSFEFYDRKKKETLRRRPKATDPIIHIVMPSKLPHYFDIDHISRF